VLIDAISVPSPSELECDPCVIGGRIDACRRRLGSGLDILALRDLRERGAGEVILPGDDWHDEVIGGAHHMGTTRMSADTVRRRLKSPR
jgi:hypothetical protein